jgi:hypothetical protein
MRLEAFTCHKEPRRPHANDDRIVIAGSGLFCVIDGVTDKSGRALADGSSRGQAAGVLIERALLRLLSEGRHMTATTAGVLEAIQQTFSAEYRRLGIEEEVAADPHLRFGAQLAALFHAGDVWRVFVVGDCGVRINAQRVITSGNKGDAVLALWRAAVFAAVLGRGPRADVTAGPTAPEQERTAHTDLALDIARRYTVAGSGRFIEEFAEWFPEDEYRRCTAQAERDARARFDHLGSELVADTLAHGLIGLAKHRNAAGPLGSPCIDGTLVPPEQARDDLVTASEVTTLELFSDGYFGTPPPGATMLADWEAHLAHVETVDPHKVGAYPSTKGSGSSTFTDDRTVVIIEPGWTTTRQDRPANPTSGEGG